MANFEGLSEGQLKGISPQISLHLEGSSLCLWIWLKHCDSRSFLGGGRGGSAVWKSTSVSSSCSHRLSFTASHLILTIMLVTEVATLYWVVTRDQAPCYILWRKQVVLLLPENYTPHPSWEWGSWIIFRNEFSRTRTGGWEVGKALLAWSYMSRLPQAPDPEASPGKCAAGVSAEPETREGTLPLLSS